MHETYFTFRSLTAAQDAAAACRSRGASVALIRAPQSLSIRGCGYALRVPGAWESHVALILRLEQITYEHAYRQQNGRMVEVIL